jgi:hypothetical protein
VNWLKKCNEGMSAIFSKLKKGETQLNNFAFGEGVRYVEQTWEIKRSTSTFFRKKEKYLMVEFRCLFVALK